MKLFNIEYNYSDQVKHTSSFLAEDSDAAVSKAHELYPLAVFVSINENKGRPLKQYWRDYPSESSSILLFDLVQIASVQGTNDDKYEIYNYDSDFQGLFDPLNGKVFNALEEAQVAAEEVLLSWVENIYKTLFGLPTEQQEPVIDKFTALREVRKLYDIITSHGNVLVPNLPGYTETTAKERLVYFNNVLVSKYGIDTAEKLSDAFDELELIHPSKNSE